MNAQTAPLVLNSFRSRSLANQSNPLSACFSKKRILVNDDDDDDDDDDADDDDDDDDAD